MRSLFGNIWDLILPPSKETLVVRAVDHVVVEELYRPGNIDGVTYLSSYQEPLIRTLIVAAKFQNNKKAASLLARLLEVWFDDNDLAESVWIPIPLSNERERERGFNQVQRILESCSAIDRSDILIDILLRQRDTRPQTTLPKTDRQANVAGAFAAADDSGLAGQSVILVDDVVTSGATLRAARAALARLRPASITCLALAH